MEDSFICVLKALIKRTEISHMTCELRGTEDLLPSFLHIPLKATWEESEKNGSALMST